VEKHLSKFYPQDGGESQLALKLRHCHPMYGGAPITGTGIRVLFNPLTNRERKFAET